MSVKNKRRLLALSVGLFLFTIYLFVYRGGFHSIDEVSMFAVTESLAKFGRFNTDQIAWTQWTTTQAEAQGFFGPDGHVYSKKGLALSLAQVPLYWLALHLPGLGMLQTTSLLNGLITAATALLIFMFVRRLGFALITSLWTAFIYGLATIAFVYAKYLFSEPLAGFLLLLAAYMLFVYRREKGRHHVAIAGLAAGLAVLTRANNLFLVPVFGLYLLWTLYKPALPQPPGRRLSHWISPIIVFVLSLAIPAAILLTYNTVRSGNPFQTGYDLTLFSPNLLLGLYKLLFSPLRGLFVYSPILLVSLPGWWFFRRAYPAEAWLFAGLAGITLGLFSAWSSGEGLSWGSRFLVPVVPFFVITLAPFVESILKPTGTRPPLPTSSNPPTTVRLSSPASFILHLSFYLLLSLSFLIQILGVSINPWIFLAQLQTDFGGEFFLENTAALYDFRYSQIVGQLQNWSLQNSDIVWWQPWGFDFISFGLSFMLVLLAGWTLRQTLTRPKSGTTSSPLRSPPLLLISTVVATLLITYLFLARAYHTDRQFGPPNDQYSRALKAMLSRASPGDRLVTVAQNHYHVPMNRFKARVPLIGFARQPWPPPETMAPLLEHAVSGPAVWLVTVGFLPAAPDNATEQWLTFNAFKAGDTWFDDARLVHYSAQSPTSTRPIHQTLGREIELQEIWLIDSRRPGRLVPVRFLWQPLEPPQADYHLFLQLLAPNGSLVAQHDSPPNGGYTPTSTWPANRPVSSRHALALPPDLSPGTYRLIAGLYNPATGQRLPVETGRDLVELGALTIIDQMAVQK